MKKSFQKINLKWFWCSGIVAVVVYVFAVIIGGVLYPGYSHISQDISQLTSTNSPIRNLMNVFFVHNILVTIFGLGLYKIGKNIVSKIAAAFIIAIGLLGIVIAWFPVNTRGTAITLTGIAHIVIVTIVSLLTVTSGFLFWFGYRNTKLQIFAKISLTSGFLFIISGPIAAFYVLSPYAGLLERIPIGIFLLWILISSAILLKKHN